MWRISPALSPSAPNRTSLPNNNNLHVPSSHRRPNSVRSKLSSTKSRSTSATVACPCCINSQSRQPIIPITQKTYLFDSAHLREVFISSAEPRRAKHRREAPDSWVGAWRRAIVASPSRRAIGAKNALRNRRHLAHGRAKCLLKAATLHVFSPLYFYAMHCTPAFTGSYDINQIRCTSMASVLAAPLKAARRMGDVPDFGLHVPFRMPLGTETCLIITGRHAEQQCLRNSGASLCRMQDCSSTTCTLCVITNRSQNTFAIASDTSAATGFQYFSCDDVRLYSKEHGVDGRKPVTGHSRQPW